MAKGKLNSPMTGTPPVGGGSPGKFTNRGIYSCYGLGKKADYTTITQRSGINITPRPVPMNTPMTGQITKGKGKAK